MIAVSAAIVASVAAGVALERRLGTARARRLGRGVLTAMLWALLPFVNFVVIDRLHVTAGVSAGLGLAYAELLVVGLVAYLIGDRFLRLARPSTGALICVTSMVNTGYLGVPLVGALLGTGALGAAIAFDSLVSGPMFYVAGFAVGAAFGAGGRRREQGALRTFVLRNPPLLAVLAGLAAPRALAPDALLHAAHVVVYALLPLGFLVLGINLATEAEGGTFRFPPPLTRPVAAALGLRLLAAPLLLAGLALLVPGVPRAYLVQAAMPSAINSLVVAHAYGLDLRLTAAALAWTTLVVVLTGLALALALP